MHSVLTTLLHTPSAARIGHLDGPRATMGDALVERVPGENDVYAQREVRHVHRICPAHR